MYRIPENYIVEIEQFGAEIQKFRRNEIEPEHFRHHRVPMGIYEQRTDNTYMLRLRCVAGCVSPLQVKEVARLGVKYKADSIHVTTRQELQFHGISLESTYKIMKEIYPFGLSVRGGGGNTVRNVLASIDAGISKDEIFDVTPHAVVLTNIMIADSKSWDLPRKFKIAFSGNSADNSHAKFNDLGFIAKIQNNQKGFEVYFGGGSGGKPMLGELLYDFLPETEIFSVAVAARELFSRYGNRTNKNKARLRYVFYSLGKEKVFELFHEILKELSPINEPIVSIENQRFEPRISPTKRMQTKKFLLWKKRYCKAQKQRNYYSIDVPSKNGNYTINQLEQIGKFAQNFGTDSIRFTLKQNLVLRNIPAKYLPNAYNLLKQIGIDLDVPFVVNSVVSCTGADTCRLGICLSKGAVNAIQDGLRKEEVNFLDQLSDIQINLSGCPNSCGQHNTNGLGFYGKVKRGEKMYPAYFVNVGGQQGENAQLGQNIGEVPAKRLPQFVVAVMKDYAKSKSTYTSFNEYLNQQGKQYILQLCEDFKTPPSVKNDPDFYTDWGKLDFFSLAGLGKGEES